MDEVFAGTLIVRRGGKVAVPVTKTAGRESTAQCHGDRIMRGRAQCLDGSPTRGIEVEAIAPTANPAVAAEQSAPVTGALTAPVTGALAGALTGAVTGALTGSPRKTEAAVENPRGGNEDVLGFNVP